jgi:hypothetical protein
MSILNTGRQQLAQADALNKQSTNLRNQMAASNAGLEMADRNNKQSMRGNALGGMASMAIAKGGEKLAEYGLSNAAPVGQSLANAEAMGGSGLKVAENAGVQLSTNQAAQQAGQQAAQQAGQQVAQQATQEATNQVAQQAAQETTSQLAQQAGTKAAETLATTATSGLASAGSAALAAIPYIGWAAAIGSMAYSLFS